MHTRLAARERLRSNRFFSGCCKWQHPLLFSYHFFTKLFRIRHEYLCHRAYDKRTDDRSDSKRST